MTALPAALPHSNRPSSESGGWIALGNISWELYERLRRETEDQNLRITFDNGRMVLMSPLQIHEFIKKVLGRLIETTTIELDIPCLALGSTTWKRKDLAKGLEADECYYIQNESVVRGLKEISLDSDPPPDLAVEVDITHQPVNRQDIYLALGVPELWQFDGERVIFMQRTTDGSRYEPITQSIALPMLTTTIVNDYLARASISPQTALIREFQDWLKSLQLLQ